MNCLSCKTSFAPHELVDGLCLHCTARQRDTLRIKLITLMASHSYGPMTVESAMAYVQAILNSLKNDQENQPLRPL